MKKIIAIAIFFVSQSVLSDSVEVKIIFEKKPPKSGMFYVVEKSASGKKAIVDQKDKQFVSNFIVADSAGGVVFKNSDSVDHNIYANDTKQGVQFDVGLMQPEYTIDKKIDWGANTVVRLGCKIHPKMRAYLANVNSKNFISFEFEKGVNEYSYTLTNVPSSNSDFGFLIPGYESKIISVKSGEEVRVELTKRGVKKADAVISRK